MQTLSRQFSAEAGTAVASAQAIRLPFLVYVILANTVVVWVAIGTKFLGFRLAGWSWVLPLVLAAFVLVDRRFKHGFPLKIWFLWLLLLGLHLPWLSNLRGVQRMAMLFSPVIIGVAVSSYDISEDALSEFSRLCRWLVVILVVYVLFIRRFLWTRAPLFGTAAMSGTDLPGHLMTAALLGALLVSEYVSGERWRLVWWSMLNLVSVLALIRGPMVAVAATLPLTLSPMKPWKRALVSALVAWIGVMLFYTPTMQHRMFYSGGGTLSEVNLNNPVFATTGRKESWSRLIEKAREKPWLGHGHNAQERFMHNRETGTYGQPHNDWIRLLFDYGIVGSSVFALCVILQTVDAWRKARQNTGYISTLFYAGASSFVPFVLLMLTDNILLYVNFFGNLQFTILGLAYGTQRASSDRVYGRHN